MIVLALGGIATPAFAATWTVDRYGSGDYTTIQAAINAASSGDSISVLPATYTETVDYKGKNLDISSTGGAAVTIIDGDGATSAVTLDSGESSSAALSGFTVRNSGGHAILTENSSPTFSDLSITDSGSTSYVYGYVYGGGVSVDGGAPTFDTVNFSDN